MLSSEVMHGLVFKREVEGNFDDLPYYLLYPIGRPVRATITLYPIERPVRATVTLYPIGRPIRATITLYAYDSTGDITKVTDAKIVVYTCDFDALGTETKVRCIQLLHCSDMLGHV